MNGHLSKRQQKVLDFLKDYIGEYGYPPTVREIGEGVGISSTSLVSYYLDGLEEHEMITRHASISRGIRLAPELEEEIHAAEFEHDDGQEVSIPFLGYIVASAPIPVEALPGSETIELNRALFGRNTSELFALKVQGNSMIDALVHDGDTVILHHQEQVENGEMAAVWLNDNAETTLKKVYYEGQQVRLQPANPTMDPIYVPADQVQVQGKVVMVIRRLA
jgi:repressor LexA